VALGASYERRDLSLHVTAEWFDAVTRFEIMDVAAGPEPLPFSTGDLAVDQALRSIINVGLGVEYRARERFTVFGSAFTDFSAYDDRSDVALSTWDIWHLSGGASFAAVGVDVTLGLNYGFGSDTVLLESPLSAIYPESELVSRTVETDVRYDSLTFTLGFDLAL
jgi:hypothetical protein